MTDKYHFRIVWALAAVAALLLSCEPNSVTGEEPEPGVPEVPVEQEWSLELGKVTSYSAELIMETAAVAEHDVKILYTETASSDPLAAGTAYISGEGSHWTAELRGLSASTRYVAGLYIDNELDHPIKMLNFLTPEEDALVTGTELSSEGNSLLISGNVLDLSAGISKSVQYGIAYNSDVDPMGNGGPLVLSGNLSDKSYSVLLEGLAPGVLYYYRAWANIDGGIHYGGLQTFTVLLTVDESEAVDLGLSVLWSGRNLGTESPAQYLDHYYAWGETEWHTGSYDWMVYKDKDYNKMPLSISGNAEYDAAKDEQRDIEARIEELEKILKNAEVVVEDEVDLDKINIGCCVKIRDLEYNEDLEYKIVGSTEANSLKGKISNESPVGKALIGHKTGDVVEVETQAGTLKYQVLEIQRSN